MNPVTVVIDVLPLTVQIEVASVPEAVIACPDGTVKPPSALIRPDEEMVPVFKVAMVSLPWAVGYVKNYFLQFPRLNNLMKKIDKRWIKCYS